MEEIGNLSFEAAMAELDGIIKRLESGDVELDAAVAAYERGTKLADHCARLLDATEQRLTQLMVGGRGVEEKPLAISAAEALEPAPAAVPRAKPIDPDEIPF